ncbi:hypothetical protein Val02_82720 [Virgisporangium aliadipatigenens]|uniref:Uncharacterized protein n=1 Tax=Virgisporangium aliadipatigenens TaxID=741659 RepID=A0A8J4DVF1_9ACTN|nr:hypothetical protein Val02_82720 [Virgisporangium aliadipatigenens]
MRPADREDREARGDYRLLPRGFTVEPGSSDRDDVRSRQHGAGQAGGEEHSAGPVGDRDQLRVGVQFDPPVDAVAVTGASGILDLVPHAFGARARCPE